MSRFSPPMVRACPRCDEPILERRLGFIHLDLIPRWSDGYGGHWAKGTGPFGCCPVCEHLFWLACAPKLGILGPENPKSQAGWAQRFLKKFRAPSAAISPEQPVWRNTQPLGITPAYIESPKGRDLMWALKEGRFADREQEGYLRTQLWWRGNHARRGHRQENPMTPDQARSNQEELLLLIQCEPPETKPIAAEIELLRTLGHFDTAIARLAEAKSLNPEFVEEQRNHALRRDTSLFQWTSVSAEKHLDRVVPVTDISRK